MSAHTLRGGCHCGRNLYIVQLPQDATEHARLLFDPTPLHRTALASPLPAYLRVPLAWYHSTTNAFFPSETPAAIHRVYDHPSLSSVDGAQPVRRRHFCGFCGTPLTYWSDAPRPEAEYIRLALGSLHADDLDQLEEWVGDDDEEEEDETGEEASEDAAAEENKTEGLSFSSTGLPWLDRFVEGSRLERRLLRQQRRQQQQQQEEQQQQQAPFRVQRHEHQAATSADGTVRVEWEVVEWTEADEADEANEVAVAEDEAAKTGPGSSSRPVLRTASSSKPSAKRARVTSDDEGGMDVEK